AGRTAVLPPPCKRTNERTPTVRSAREEGFRVERRSLDVAIALHVLRGRRRRVARRRDPDRPRDARGRGRALRILRVWVEAALVPDHRRHGRMVQRVPYE